MRKRRTREHIIADLSVNHVERFVLLAGHAPHRIILDYGYDLIVQTFDANGEMESGSFLFQLKSSDNPTIVTDGNAFAVVISRRDLEAWTEEREPVYLVLFDAPQETAYWQLMTKETLPSAILAGQSETVTIRIPASQRLNVESIETFQQTKNIAIQRERMRRREQEEEWLRL